MRYITILLLLCIAVGCKNNAGEPGAATAQDPIKDVAVLTADYNTWWSYHYNDVNLTGAFTALGTAADTLGKRDFLEKLSSGKYVTIQLKTKNQDKPTYKLYEVPEDAPAAIATTLKSVVNTNLYHYTMEGKLFPEWKGVTISGDSIVGNKQYPGITVYKTWFIGCAACIAEFPELNTMVESLKGEEIRFVSLARDSTKDLKDFLAEREFAYQTVAEQKDFIQEELQFNIYPTHIIVGSDNRIHRVVNRAVHLEKELRLYLKEVKNNRIAPPPPPPGGTS